VQPALARYTEIAQSRLQAGAESELPAIQAWRRAFARMGLKPTQYRCASEALLRRLRKEGTLPPLHPLVDLCNAVSVAYAVPVAVFVDKKGYEVTTGIGPDLMACAKAAVSDMIELLIDRRAAALPVTIKARTPDRGV
jgi:hypothetical protein